MYRIEEVDVGLTPNNWGEISITKNLNVKCISPICLSKSPLRSTIKKSPQKSAQRGSPQKRKSAKKVIPADQQGVHGYIIQHVDKKTHAAILTDTGVKRIHDIEQFTNDRVKYMNDSYYEVFPVINGEALDGDDFRNGAILRYVRDGKKYFADNNPPTAGTIDIIGNLFFIPDTEINVKKTITTLSKKRLPATIKLFNVDWETRKDTPANGLLFSSNNVSYNIMPLSKSEPLIHKVSVWWNGITGNKLNVNANIKNRNNIYTPLVELNSVSDARNPNAMTRITSDFIR